MNQREYQRTYHKSQLSNQHGNFVISSFRKQKNNISFIISCGATIECVINVKKSIIQRPIQKLILLEITKRNTEVLPNVNNNFNENSLNESLPNVNEHKDVQRPKRTAAANANAIDYFVVGSVNNYAYNYFAMIGHAQHAHGIDEDKIYRVKPCKFYM